MKNKNNRGGLAWLVVGGVVLLMTACSSTMYGVPKSEWNTLTPREQQQLAASQQLERSQKPAFLKIFEKPQLTPEQQAQADIEAGNNNPTVNKVPPPAPLE